MARPPLDPATQVRGLKIAAAALVVAGLVVGIGLPALFTAFHIEVAMMSWGFDAIWFVMLAMMLVDFGMAGICGAARPQSTVRSRACRPAPS